MRSIRLSSQSFALFHERVIFGSNSEQILDDLVWLYTPAVSEEAPTAEVRVMKSNGQIIVETPRDRRRFDSYWEALLFGLKARLLELFWHTFPRPILLHAAAVCRNGQGLLLLGPDGVGKSTIALALSSQGYDIYSDEYGVLETRTMMLFPYPAPMAARSSSLSLMGYRPELRPHLFERNVVRGLAADLKYLLPLPIKTIPTSCHLSHIILLEGPVSQHPRVSSVDSTYFIELLRTPPQKDGRFCIHGSLSNNETLSSIRQLENKAATIGIKRVSQGNVKEIAKVLELTRKESEPS